VGWCDLGINGRSCRTYLKSATLSLFDVILGESWLKEHRGVLDYADNRLWQKDPAGNLRPLTFDKPGIDMPPSEVNRIGSRACHMRRRHASVAFSMQSYLQAVLDFTKELPEDVELDLGDIPGITPSARASFSFVEEEVRAQLTHLPEAQLDEIVSRLRAFEGDVFETRTQLRPPPIRPGFDVPIVEKEGSEPLRLNRSASKLVFCDDSNLGSSLSQCWTPECRSIVLPRTSSCCVRTSSTTCWR